MTTLSFFTLCRPRPAVGRCLPLHGHFFRVAVKKTQNKAPIPAVRRPPPLSTAVTRTAAGQRAVVDDDASDLAQERSSSSNDLAQERSRRPTLLKTSVVELSASVADLAVFVADMSASVAGLSVPVADLSASAVTFEKIFRRNLRGFTGLGRSAPVPLDTFAGGICGTASWGHLSFSLLPRGAVFVMGTTSGSRDENNIPGYEDAVPGNDDIPGSLSFKVAAGLAIALASGCCRNPAGFRCLL